MGRRPLLTGQQAESYADNFIAVHAQAFPSFGSERMRLQARSAHPFRPGENTEVIDRIQAAADRNITRFGLLADSSTERAGVAAPGHG